MSEDSSRLTLVETPVSNPDRSLREIRIVIDRQKLARRRWRAKAEDGHEFGVVVEAALRDGDTAFQTGSVRYVVHQAPEKVLEIPLDVPSSAAAGIGWAIGNLHMDLASEPTRLLAPDETAVRRLLDRLGVRYQPATAIFRPGRFSRGARESQELGLSHKHG